MTAEELKSFAKRELFLLFTIHMNDGSKLKVRQPDDLFIYPSWRLDALVVLGSGRWSWVYLRNIAHVSSRGHWTRLLGRKRRNGHPLSDE